MLSRAGIPGCLSSHFSIIFKLENTVSLEGVRSVPREDTGLAVLERLWQLGPTQIALTRRRGLFDARRTLPECLSFGFDFERYYLKRKSDLNFLPLLYHQIPSTEDPISEEQPLFFPGVIMAQRNCKGVLMRSFLLWVLSPEDLSRVHHIYFVEDWALHIEAVGEEMRKLPVSLIRYHLAQPLAATKCAREGNLSPG
uniref:Uncharacterized protein n=1 Tax=Candidatus Kentrum sp. LPFa TaxID=2126335 RepID=A0A450WH66_9GAMM|nr:MAG: hypothetical protein BECKLPF1236A_GA0070988_101452 [Candidatus Kentron sp. LPFa]